MSQSLIVACAIVVALAVGLLLTFTKFARSESWIATVTPLASIIGSGFLICGPLLAREFGLFAAPAMAILLLLAYAAGWVIRYNIVHVEPHLTEAHTHDPVQWTARIAKGMLAVAYAISVAYYLKLLAVFGLRPLGQDDNVFLTNLIVTAIIVALGLLAFTGGLRRVERVAHASVSVKLGLIAGMLAALALDWVAGGGVARPLPPVLLSPASILMLLGLLITVQGFETSRYMGDSYDAETRVRTMRNAQLIASAIYLLFILLLTPRLGQAAETEGVAGVLDVMEAIAPFLGIFVLAGALSSQLSAAVADSIGSTGIAVELSDRRLSTATGFLLAGGLAIAVTWMTDAIEIIVLASRAFAVFYGMQAILAIIVAWKDGKGTAPRYAGFAGVALMCLVAAVAGAPAEG
ncbi:hypothetical protein [Stakelama saccharophila]|uniref:Uncharacterized protein n=1 Tax=Stakelama saccharophila TaxID=3075605 RepID=A0ABZ0BCE2_9SPHN|nr:hypothetical protein [Stakelama sp. W311]WNO53964.1 hypothetical protein RPR59_01505 [Stakelama sp. W311]